MNETTEMPISKLYIDDCNVRSSPGTIGHLENSIKDEGLQHPLIVRKGENGKYGIVIGGRRFVASKCVGLTVLPVIVKDLTDEEAILASFAENAQRDNLSEKDQAKVVARFYESLKSQRKVANKLNISQTVVREHLIYAGLLQVKEEVYNDADGHAHHPDESTPSDDSVPAGEYDDESTPEETPSQPDDDSGSTTETESVLGEDTTKMSQIASAGKKLFPDDPKKQVELAERLKDESRGEVRSILKQLRQDVKDGKQIDDIGATIESIKMNIPQKLSINVSSHTHDKLLKYSEEINQSVPEIIMEAIETFLKEKMGAE